MVLLPDIIQCQCCAWALCVLAVPCRAHRPLTLYKTYGKQFYRRSRHTRTRNEKKYLARKKKPDRRANTLTNINKSDNAVLKEKTTGLYFSVMSETIKYVARIVLVTLLYYTLISVLKEVKYWIGFGGDQGST